jgi:hypothetical protein
VLHGHAGLAVGVPTWFFGQKFFVELFNIGQQLLPSKRSLRSKRRGEQTHAQGSGGETKAMAFYAVDVRDGVIRRSFINTAGWTTSVFF